MKEKDQIDDEGARSFGVFLANHAQGTLLAEVSEEQRKLLEELHQLAINMGGKAKGELRLVLRYQVESSGLASMVSIDPDIVIKTPKPRRAKGIYWLTKGNNLTADNPAQQKLPLRQVPPVESPIRDIAADGGPVRSV